VTAGGGCVFVRQGYDGKNLRTSPVHVGIWNGLQEEGV